MALTLDVGLAWQLRAWAACVGILSSPLPSDETWAGSLALLSSVFPSVKWGQWWCPPHRVVVGPARVRRLAHFAL